MMRWRRLIIQRLLENVMHCCVFKQIRSLSTSEVRDLIPVIGKINMYYLLWWKDKTKEKESGNGPLKLGIDCGFKKHALYIKLYGLVGRPIT